MSKIGTGSMRILMLFAEGYDYRLPKLFSESGWDVLLFNGGLGDVIDQGATESIDVVESWRPYVGGLDLVICNQPALLFKYHEAAKGMDTPVLYIENSGSRRSIARLVRGISPLQQDLVLSAIYPEPMDIPIEGAKKKRRWWRRGRG